MTRTYADGWHAALAAAANVLGEGIGLKGWAGRILALPLPAPAAVGETLKPPMGDAERQRKLVKIDALIAALPPCVHCNSERKMKGEGFMGVPVVRDCPFCVGALRAQTDAIWAEPAPSETATVAAACATCGRRVRGIGEPYRMSDCVCDDAGRAHGRGGEKT